MNFAAGEKFDLPNCGAQNSPCKNCGADCCGFRGIASPGEAIRFLDLARGESLESKRGACLRFWTVVSGNAATSTGFRDGRRQILSIEGVGDTICGSMASPDSEQKLEALTDCHICELDLSPWATELMSDPTFLTISIRLVHARLEKSVAHVAALGRLDSHERVIYFLAEMAVQRPGTDRVVALPMSREDIADYLGLNTDSVSRVLSRIRKSGLFRFISPTEYTMPSIEAVARRLPLAVPRIAERRQLGGGHAS